MSRQFERQMDQIDRDLQSGVISNAQHRKEVQEMNRAYRDECDEACRNAAEQERERW